MTNEEINRLIYEQIMGECWHEFDATKDYQQTYPAGHVEWRYPCIKCSYTKSGERERTKSDRDASSYCTDLNAVARAEAKVILTRGARALSNNLWTVFCKEYTAPDDIYTHHYVFSTARQRAEAVLRCVDLWRDDD